MPTIISRRLTCIGLAGLMMATAANATADAGSNQEKSARLLPSSPWNLEYSDDSCRLSRIFGPASSPSLIAFEQIAPGSSVTMITAGSEIAALGAFGDLRIGKSATGPRTRVIPMPASMSKYGAGYILPGVSFADAFFSEVRYDFGVGRYGGAGIEPQDAASVSGILFERSGRTVFLETGNMEQPLRALNSCTGDLLQHWGLGVDDHRGHTPVALHNENTQISRIRSKYARGPGRKRHEALLTVQAIIDADGAVSKCDYRFAPATSGDSFDVCADLRKMRFDPAKAADGRAIRSFYALTIPLSWVDPLAL